MAPAQLRIMLVEDHAILRDILTDYLGNLPQVAGCVSLPNAEDALAKLRGTNGNPPDLMLIDLSLPGMNGIELVREIRRAHPELRCAILSGHRSRAYAGEALAAGALAYMLKGDPIEIERGLDAILSGNRYVSRSLGDEH